MRLEHCYDGGSRFVSARHKLPNCLASGSLIGLAICAVFRSDRLRVYGATKRLLRSTLILFGAGVKNRSPEEHVL